MYIADIAKVAHEANRAYCQTLGDNSQVPWEEAPDWQKESAVNGVLMCKNTPTGGIKLSHESWMAEKLAQGWKYGPVKDVDKKEHPCLVPFDDLPKNQQIKDVLFTAIALALLAENTVE